MGNNLSHTEPGQKMADGNVLRQENKRTFEVVSRDKTACFFSEMDDGNVLRQENKQMDDGNVLRQENKRMDDGYGFRRENPLLDIPWRMFGDNGSWTKEYRDALIQYICSTIPRDGVSNFKLLLLGPVYAGKSTFVNAVASIDADDITQVVDCGGGMIGTTRKRTFYYADQKLKNFILCDTMGFEEEKDYREHEENGLKLSDIGPLLNGHIKRYSGDWDMSISRENVEEPSFSDKIHCVALVIDSDRFLHEQYMWIEMKSLQGLINEIKRYGCPLVVILTKIDKICDEVKRNISMTFSSRNVERCVKEASDMFGIQVMNIYPVQNYTEQMGLDCKMDILILMALKHMIKLSNGYIKMLRNNTEDAEHRNNTEGAKHRNNTEGAKHRNNTEDAEHRNSSEDAEHKNSSEDAEHKNGSEDAEHKNSSEDAEHNNSSEDAEHKNSSEDAEHKNSSEDAEHKNSSEDAEHKNSSEDAEKTQV